jgi:hypothetical protein
MTMNKLVLELAACRYSRMMAMLPIMRRKPKKKKKVTQSVLLSDGVNKCPSALLRQFYCAVVGCLCSIS